MLLARLVRHRPKIINSCRYEINLRQALFDELRLPRMQTLEMHSRIAHARALTDNARFFWEFFADQNTGENQ